MKKTSRRSLQRDRFVHVARLRRLLAAFTGAGDGDFDSLRIDIDGDTGKLLESDGEGNHAAVLWNAAGLVALEYVHDIPEAREDATPERHLQGVPIQLADLAEAAASFGPRIATSGAWALGDEGGGDWRDMRMLEPHTCPPEEAVEMLSSLGPKASALVVRAERATRSGGTYTMTEADADAVFGKKAPDPAHVAKAVKELERAGVLWPGGVARAKTVAAALANAPPKLTRSRGAFFAAPSAVSMMPPGSLQRDRFVEVARLRRLLEAFDGVHGGPLDELDVESDGETGTLVERGNAQIVVASWNDAGLVALAFDARSGKARGVKAAAGSKTTDVLERLPPSLADLAEAARSLGQGAPMDAVWALGNEGSRRCPLGIRRLECYTWPPDAVLTIACATTPRVAELVVRAERATRTGKYTMTDDDADAILAGRPRPHPANVTPAVRALERAGVLWPGIVERTQRAHDEAVAARALAEAPLQDALLRAAFEGDLPAVRAALESGAAIDCVTYDKMLEWNLVGATPLWLALRKGHFEIAEHLVRAGADVDRASQNGCHGAGKCVPLRVAAAFGHAGLVRLLLERGADILRDEWFWGILRAVADGRQWLGSTGQVGSSADYAEVIRLLLDAGAPLPNPRACHVLSEMVAAGGAPELAERLVPPPDRMLPG